MASQPNQTLEEKEENSSYSTKRVSWFHYFFPAQGKNYSCTDSVFPYRTDNWDN